MKLNQNSTQRKFFRSPSTKSSAFGHKVREGNKTIVAFDHLAKKTEDSATKSMFVGRKGSYIPSLPKLNYQSKQELNNFKVVNTTKNQNFNSLSNIIPQMGNTSLLSNFTATNHETFRQTNFNQQSGNEIVKIESNYDYSERKRR